MDRYEISSICDAIVAPGYRCGHLIERHIVHGSLLLECWQCEDWHAFMPRRVKRDRGNDGRAAA